MVTWRMSGQYSGQPTGLVVGHRLVDQDDLRRPGISEIGIDPMLAEYRVRLMISLDRRAPLDPVEQRIKIIGAA